MGCRFCATGTMGFKSNLSSGEIVEQLVHASRYSEIRNVVFMVISIQFVVSCLKYIVI
jgi:adenine C2-methylase RlmN of 23S rRNA A2503 and tRNA A37